MKSVLAKTALALWCLASPTMAQSANPDDSEAAAQAALSVLGIAATPNETLSSLSFLQVTGGSTRLRSTQLRGGTTPFDNGLYIEGLVAYQEYKPGLLFPNIVPGAQLDVTWASVATTIGVGWEFPLGEHWKIRPLGHVSLGRVAADASLVDFPLVSGGSTAANGVDGTLDAFGVGASLGVYREAEFGAWQAEYRFRHTFLQFYPINEPQAGDAKANSNQTTLFSRHRYSLPEFRIFDLSTNLVLDAGLVFYHGDAATVLRTDWLAKAGIGLEVDVGQTGLPAVRAMRVMLNGVVTEETDGLSIGFGLRF